MQPREVRHEFSVPFVHRVIFCDQVLDPNNPLLKDLMPGQSGPARALAFVDGSLAGAAQVPQRLEQYFTAHTDALRFAAPPVLLTGGEACKRGMATVDACLQQLSEAGLDRHSYVLLIGGGAALDAAGFAASIAHRGIRHIRLPTTVLAQADAGIGVKNGVNAFGKKNYLGTFAVPAAVVNDFSLLAGLPAEQWREGTIEAVKVGLIRDASFFSWIEQNLPAIAAVDEPAMRQLIFRCAQLHLQHIATGGDPFERGSARPLDFGHWAAHKLEQMTQGKLSHGRAVAVGIAIDTTYSADSGLLPPAAAERIIRCIEQLGFRLDAGNQLRLGERDLDRILQGVEEFREHLGGTLSVTLLAALGQAVEANTITLPTMRRCLQRVLFHGKTSS